MTFLFVPIPPSAFQSALQQTDNSWNEIVTVFLVLVIPLAIRFTLQLSLYLIKRIEALLREEPEKPKHQPSTGFFEPAEEESDYVVGFGDDGELIYASEQPKRKNGDVYNGGGNV